MTLNRALRRMAQDRHKTRFDLRDSVRLVAEHEAPYAGEFWAARGNAYDYGGGEYEYQMARHYVPAEHIWQGGNRSSH